MSKRKILVTYVRHESMNDFSCFYCGAHAESVDHVPAISHAYYYPQYDRFLVRSCLLCNSFLSNNFLPNFYARCNFLLFKFRKRFQKVISMPHWSEEEINELNGKLKRIVILGMKKQKDAIKRINHLESLFHALIPNEEEDELPD